MKDFREFATSAIVSGFLIVVPAYLAVLLLPRAMSSLAGLVRPIAEELAWKKRRQIVFQRERTIPCDEFMSCGMP
jgi:hypothetical protein